jgi:ribosomal RNA-processing protein 8
MLSSDAQKPTDPNTKIDIKNTSKVSKFTKQQSKLNLKLKGGRFRWLNELLYTSHSSKSLKLFSDQPDLFSLYHEGFDSQVKDWPVNPIQLFINQLQKLDNVIVADMGCGQAEIAQKLHKQLTIHSFDLHAANEFITCCDIRKTPLKNESVDICIFSLSLMGTNLSEFILESNRILKSKGILKIAEVKSRLDELEFIKETSKFGFTLLSKV